jgi:hypothetical protein
MKEIPEGGKGRGHIRRQEMGCERSNIAGLMKFMTLLSLPR